MIVVSDTSPIRALDYLGLLSVLGDLYSEVLVPPAVANELQNPRARFRRIDVATLPFVYLKSPSGTQSVGAIDPSLDLAEAEALSLALEESADVLMDEIAGRDAAVRLGLTVTGTLGVLLEAKLQGLIPEVRSPMDRLQQGLGFFISPGLRALVLQRAGE